jgi:hypothetical protein
MAAQAKIEGRYLGDRPSYDYMLVYAGPHPNPAKAVDGERLHQLDPDPITAVAVERILARHLTGIGIFPSPGSAPIRKEASTPSLSMILFSAGQNLHELLGTFAACHSDWIGVSVLAASVLKAILAHLRVRETERACNAPLMAALTAVAPDRRVVIVTACAEPERACRAPVAPGAREGRPGRRTPGSSQEAQSRSTGREGVISGIAFNWKDTAGNGGHSPEGSVRPGSDMNPHTAFW